jgi:hypothetical protein
MAVEQRANCGAAESRGRNTKGGSGKRRGGGKSLSDSRGRTDASATGSSTTTTGWGKGCPGECTALEGAGGSFGQAAYAAESDSAGG